MPRTAYGRAPLPAAVQATSAFNIPKVGGAGGDAAGLNVNTAIVKLSSTTNISFQCNDFGSQAVAHDITLSAVG